MNASRSRRDVLADVAGGRLTPEQAAQALADLESANVAADATATSADAGEGPATRDGHDVWADVTDTPEPAPAGAHSAAVPATAEPTRVVIRAVGHRVRVTGEPSVATVSVDGSHVIRRDGGTLTVASEGEFGSSLDGFTLMRSRSVSELRDRLLGLGKELSVRVNPRLAVDVEVTAGSLAVERLPHLGQVRVTAGSARVLDAADPLDLLVQAGSAKVDVKPTSGRSRLRVESGSLDVRVRPGADVRVRSDAQAGRVHWHGQHHQGNADEVVLGTGSAVMNVEAVMGSVSMRAD